MTRVPQGLPSRSELEELPGWEMLAFAAYCARLVLPLVKPDTQVCVRHLIGHAEEAVRARRPAEYGIQCSSEADSPEEAARLAATLCSFAAAEWVQPRPDIVQAVLKAVERVEPATVPAMRAMFERLRSSARSPGRQGSTGPGRLRAHRCPARDGR